MSSIPTSIKADGEKVDVTESTERWSNYTLSDGTVVKAKVTIISATRLKNQFDQNNRPIYAIEATMTTVVAESPEHLLKPS